MSRGRPGRWTSPAEIAVVTPPCMADSTKSRVRCRGVKSPKTGWTWESTSPGITVEPLASTTRSASSSSPWPSPMMTPSRARSESASTTGCVMSPLTICPMFRIRVFMRGPRTRPAASRWRQVQTDRGTSARPSALTQPYAPWARLVSVLVEGPSPGRLDAAPGGAPARATRPPGRRRSYTPEGTVRVLVPRSARGPAEADRLRCYGLEVDRLVHEDRVLPRSATPRVLGVDVQDRSLAPDRAREDRDPDEARRDLGRGRRVHRLPPALEPRLPGLDRARRLVADPELERARDQAANPAPLVPVRQRASPRVELDALAAHQVLLAGLESDRMLEERLGGGARNDVRPALASTPQELVAEHHGARRARGRQTVGRAEPGAVAAHARLHSSARHPELALEDVEHALQRGQRAPVAGADAQPILAHPENVSVHAGSPRVVRPYSTSRSSARLSEAGDPCRRRRAARPLDGLPAGRWPTV